MATDQLNPIINLMRVGNATAATITAFAIDSAFVYGTSGDSLSYDYVSRESAELTDFYFYVTAVAGTLGNIQVTCEVRNDSSGNPGSTVHATQTTTVNGAATWNRVTFGTPYTFVAGTKYHIVISNSSGAPTTDFPTIARINARYPVIDSNDLTCRSSTNGTTWSGGTASMFVAVLKFSGLSAVGNPYSSASANYTSNTRERGFYITARAATLGVWELRSGSSISNISGAKLIKSATAPGASPGAGEASGVWVSPGARFATDAVMTDSEAYRLVFTFSGNSVSPTFVQINDYARYADVQAAALYGGLIYGTIDNGAGGWTDSPEVLPVAEIWLRTIGKTDASAGGMMVNPGMSGRII